MFRIIRKQVIGEFEPGRGERMEIAALRRIADYLAEQDRLSRRGSKVAQTEPVGALADSFEFCGPDGIAVSVGLGSQAYDADGEYVSPVYRHPDTNGDADAEH